MKSHQVMEVSSLSQARSLRTSSRRRIVCGASVYIAYVAISDLGLQSIVTTIRKKAMDAFLKGDRKTSTKAGSSADRSRLDGVESSSRTSTRSRSSVDHDDASTAFSTIPTTVSEYSETFKQTGQNLPAWSSVGGEDDQRSTSKQVLVANLQRPRDFILPAAPIVVPSRKGIPLPYDKYIPQPFVSIGKSLDPFRTMFQAQHPGVSVEQLKFYCLSLIHI